LGKKKIGTSKEVKAIITQAKAQGWEVDMTGGNHIQFLPVDRSKPPIITSLTASDSRQFKNFLARMKRAGFITKK
jgi:hypothetical protein